MMRTVTILAAMGLAGSLIAAQPQPVFGPESTVEFKGRIVKVRISHGQGMPHLEVERDGKPVRVQLGSMRYLLANNFNPKAGEEAEIEGFQLEGEELVVARSVRLVAQDQTLELRDENGLPRWRRGRHGQGQNRRGREGDK